MSFDRDNRAVGALSKGRASFQAATKAGFHRCCAALCAFAMTEFAILLAGPIEPTDRLLQRVAKRRVIAADAGMRHAGPLGVVPELWVGDFDSAPPTTGHLRAVERLSFSRDKDQTDGEIAIETAIERGAKSLLLVGALGGPRSDHAFAHLVLALRYAEAGFAVELFDGREEGHPLRPGEPRHLDLAAGTPFSILKFTDLSGLSVEGAAYPLEGIDLPFTSILTQSNEALGLITIRIEAGRAILLAQSAPDEAGSIK